MIKVSILVPVYGVEKFIERCARSLMEQTYQNIEYIFVDDCSPDNSIKILNSVLSEYHRDSVSIIRHEKNKGLGGARRTALFAATGDYILNVDSDDYLETNAVTLLVEEAENTKADIIRMNCYFEWENTRAIYSGHYCENALQYTLLLLNSTTLPSIWAHLIKKELYYTHNLFPEENINMGEDFILVPRLCYYANKIGQVKKALYHYIQTNYSSYTSVFNENKVRSLCTVANTLYDFFCDKPKFIDALNEGMWQKKVEMMLSCPYQFYPQVDQLPTWLPMSTRTMNIQQKLAAPLVERKCWKILWIYNILYNRTFSIYQKLKGR